MSLKTDATLIARFIVDFPFKLEKLTMGHMYERKLRSAAGFACESSRYCPNDRLVHFLLQQAETLRYLTVHNCPYERMLRFIVSDFRLTKLEIGIEAIQINKKMFDEVAKNQHLKELSFYGVLKGKAQRVKMVMKIIEQFPAIEKLNMFNSQTNHQARDVIGLQSLNPKVEIVFADVKNEEFNNIPNVNFYVNADNMKEFQVLHQERTENARRVNEIFETELREAITLEVKKMGINSNI
jgi:hypothetical protein